MEDNVSWLKHSNDRFCIWKHLLNHICVTEALNRPQKPPKWCYIKVSFLNHIASVLSERGLRCGAVYHPLMKFLNSRGCNKNSPNFEIKFSRWLILFYLKCLNQEGLLFIKQRINRTSTEVTPNSKDKSKPLFHTLSKQQI